MKDNLTFGITYTYPTGEQKTVTETKKLSDFTKNADGTYTYTYTSGDIWSMGATYEVTETAYEVTGYDCATTSTNAKGSIPKYSTATATFTNAYTPSERTITLEKVVKGNMGDTNKEFHFTAANATITGNGNLADGKTTTITAKVGQVITITEDNYTSDGYTTTASATNDVKDGKYEDHSYTFTVTKDMSTSTVITFTNTKTIQPPNGITTNATPYIIMVVLAAGAAVYFVYSRRRHNG